MFFSSKKCKHLRIDSRQPFQLYVMSAGQGVHEIEQFQSENDLGLIFYSKLNFRGHITKKVALANRNLGLIFKSFTYIDKEMFISLYKSSVRLHLEYATPVWSPLFKKDSNQSEVIEAFNSTSRYMDDLLNIDNNFFDSMVNHIYPSELQLNKANVSDTEASFLDLHLSISVGFVKAKIYDKRDDFDFDIVNFPFLDGDVPCSTSYGV